MEEYLNWLDSQDRGKPWVNPHELVDYFNVLRSHHPLLVWLLSPSVSYTNIPFSQMATGF